MTRPRASQVVPPETGRVLAERLADLTGGHTRAVLMYGSHLLGAAPDRHSAYDFVVVVDAYRPFYAALKAAGELRRPPWVLASLATVLPPNAIAFAPDDGRDGIAKCLVVRTDHFEAALGPRPRDHFLLGRMLQRVSLVWAASAEEGAWVEDQLAGAQDRVLDWMAPYVEGAFDAPELGRQILAVCYRGEIRPESGDRSERIFEAQTDHFAGALLPGLELAEERGDVLRDGEVFRLAHVPGAGRRAYWRWHFVRSKARTTSRWVKHVLTFDNWLPYITRKVERRTGMKVELTPLERSWPLIFLWPRVFRVLRARPNKEGGA